MPDEKERDANAEGSLEGTGDGTSSDKTGAAIQDAIDAEDAEDDEDGE